MTMKGWRLQSFMV